MHCQISIFEIKMMVKISKCHFQILPAISDIQVTTRLKDFNRLQFIFSLLTNIEILATKNSYLLVIYFKNIFFGFKWWNLLGQIKYDFGAKRENCSSEETIQGRKLLIIRRFWPRKLFKGGNYSREETIRGNTVKQIRINQRVVVQLT